MASSYTSLLGLALPVTGELSGSWGDVVNDSITSLLDTAVAGTTTLSTDGDVTLSTTTGASNQARQAILLCSGARTALRTITAPAQSKIYTVINATTGGFSVKVVGAGPTTGVTIVAGESAVIAWNGSDFIKVSNTGGSASFTNVTVSGTTTLSGLTASTALALNSSKEVVSVTNTGTGNNVLSASPTLTGTVAGASLQLSSLTSGRVTYAGASGLLQDSANLTFNGTDLTVSGAVNAGTINATTLDLTNLEVTNIKAKDGTAGMQIADSTGVVSFTANPVMSGGTANGVAYLNGSKVLTTGSALTFDGSNFATTGSGTLKNLLLSGGTLPGAGNPSIALRSSDNVVYHQSGSANSIVMLDSAQNTMQSIGATAQIWNISNSEQMRLTSTGLGIGTSSPAFKLDVGGDNGTNIALRSTGTASAVFRAYVNSAEAGTIGFLNGGGTYFEVAGTEGMRLTSTGLGIGTSSPASKLHVDNGSGCRLYVGLSNNIYEQAYDHIWQTLSGASTKMTLDSSGNLGLGVTPSAWDTTVFRTLQVGSGAGSASLSGRTDSAQALVLASNTYYSSTGYRYIGTSSATGYVQQNSTHYWLTAGSGTAGDLISFTQAMTLDASGNLALGATSASARLDVVGGSIRVNEDSIGTKIITVRSDFAGLGPAINVTTSDPLLFLTNNTERARITSGGDFLVGTTSASLTGVGGYWEQSGRINLGKTGSSTYMGFYVSGTIVGSIATDGSITSYNTSSDYRLKNITGPITTSGAYIDSLNPVEGTWKADGSTFVGLIAHEVQEASRTTVATGVKDGEEMQGMDYSSAEIIANLIAEVKSLRQRLAAAGI